MQARTHNGVPFRILNVIDEYSRECLMSRAARRLAHHDVLDILTELFVQRGVPVHIRSDNGAEFTAKRVRSWLSRCRSSRCSLSREVPGRTAILNRSMER